MTEDKDPLDNIPDEAQVLAPDYALKKKIGENVDIKVAFSDENVAVAQQVINNHKDSFRDWAAKDIAALEGHYNKATKPESHKAGIAAIAEIAERLKSQAGTFDFGLATLVAKSLANFCIHHLEADADHMIVIRKHIDTLSVILGQNITGDGGQVGGELLENLKKLTEKYN